MDNPTVTFDGRQFTDFECFVRHVAPVLFDQADIWWNGDLDALDDILGSIAGHCRIVWQHSALSRHSLGHWAMVNWLASNIKYCHPSNVAGFAERLRLARLGEGPTLFEWLVEVIESHKEVELTLE